MSQEQELPPPGTRDVLILTKGIFGGDSAQERERERSVSEDSEMTTATLAETANFLIWKADEPDGEVTIHIELGTVTLHFFKEEWEEFLVLISNVN